MRLPTINIKALIATLAPLVVAGAILAPNAAANTLGFRVTNWSTHQLVLTKETGSFEAPGTKPGVMLWPGDSYGFEVGTDGQGHGAGDLYFDILAEDGHQIGTYHATLYVRPRAFQGLGRDSSCQVSVGQCTAGPGVENLKVLDPAGTKNTIPAKEAQVQAKWFKQLCDNGDNGATCWLDLMSEVHTFTALHQVSGAYGNWTDHSATHTFEVEKGTKTTDSWGGELTVSGGFKLSEVFKLFEVEIKAKYDHEVAVSDVVKEGIEAEVPPFTRMYFATINPIIRDTGTFHITLGNTEILLPDVTLDSPDPSQGGFPEYRPVESRCTLTDCPT